MAKKPEPPKLTSWSIYKIAAKAFRLGEVEALDESGAMEKAVAEFKVPPRVGQRMGRFMRRAPAREVVCFREGKRATCKHGETESGTTIVTPTRG